MRGVRPPSRSLRMILWFVVLAPVLVAEIFRSPLVDYRIVAFGAVLPSVQLIFGPPVLHTLIAPVLCLTIVMLGTIGRRLRRRRLLGLPIGLFFHLVLDGSWTSSELFWWPAFGAELGEPSVTETASIAVWIGLEVVAAIVGYFAIRRYGLANKRAASKFLKSGHLSREDFA